MQLEGKLEEAPVSVRRIFPSRHDVVFEKRDGVNLLRNLCGRGAKNRPATTVVAFKLAAGSIILLRVVKCVTDDVSVLEKFGWSRHAMVNFHKCFDAIEGLDGLAVLLVGGFVFFLPACAGFLPERPLSKFENDSKYLVQNDLMNSIFNFEA